MEGAPLSPYDNRDLWKHYDYGDFGIIGEPYFDIDFESVLYLTDTGRRWNGNHVSIRDKVVKKHKNQSPQTTMHFARFRHTRDIIRAAENGLLSYPLMITIHPQRWTNKPMPWLKELIWQNIKNVGKRILIAKRKHSIS